METKRDFKAKSLQEIKEIVTDKTLATRNYLQIERDCNKIVCNKCPDKSLCKKCDNYTVMPKGTIGQVKLGKVSFTFEQLSVLLKVLKFTS